ncbi:MAG TPA: hypothetical protein VFF39_13965, partial [Verrucomicrobiae bacterium]|nr:hypothetical protein [Verrucomicrobiae bacterium]
MKKLILLFVALAPAWANTLNPQTIYEVDNAGQTNHPFSYGVTFKQGDIPSGDCPQPATGGTVQGDGTVSGASLIATYQFDVKNTWPDGSVQWGIVSFYKTLTA